jgi:hypothetical protein
MPFWIQQDNGVNVLKLLVAITFEVCEGVCRNLHVCVGTKNLCHHPHGLLQPLPIPTPLWFLISMIFITNLPPFSPYDSILVVEDYLMKMIHFISSTKIIISEGSARLFHDNVFQHHGFPKDNIFDRGP